MSTTDNSTTSSIYRIEPLKGLENYAVWKIKMTDMLTDMGIYEHATKGMPETTVLASDVEAWKKKDRQALSMIRL
ncbi:hypothetical protein AB1N83_002396 [Pleurotus pulmonarius]